jgi:uncharacterized membrane protein
MASASAGYVLGARLSRDRQPEEVISWILVLYLPLTVPVSLWFRPQGMVEPVAWWGFAYLALFSMWLGFFAWYRGLALGGAMRVSQTQLLQPFLSMLVAVPLLGECIVVREVLAGALLIAGVGLLVKANLDRIGPMALLSGILLASLLCYAVAVRAQRQRRDRHGARVLGAQHREPRPAGDDDVARAAGRSVIRRGVLDAHAR